MPNTYTDTPIASHTLATDQPLIEGNFLYLANTLGTSNAKNGDHQISVGGVDNTTFEGRHRQVCLNNRHGAAPTVAGIADGVDSLMYSDDGNLFYGSSLGAGAFQLTTYNAGANFGGYVTIAPGGSFQTIKGAGWIFVPGGLILQYGYIEEPPATGNVQFPIAFPTNVINIAFTLQRTASGSDSVWIDSSGTNNTTRFAYKASTGSADFIYFTALGN